MNTGITDNPRSQDIPAINSRTHSFEKTLLNLVTHSPGVFIVQLDQQWCIHYLNRPALGHSIEDVRGHSVFEFVPKDQHDFLRNTLTPVFNTGVTVSYTSQAIGHYRDRGTFLQIAGPMYAEDNRIIGAMIIAHNITDHLKSHYAQQLHALNLANVAKTSSLIEFTSGVAHELNQPLAAISNYATGCGRRLQNGIINREELLRVQHRIAAQAERAGSILARLRNLVGKEKINRQLCDINHQITQAVGFLDVTKFGEDLNIQLNLAPQLPSVFIDPIQIEQVIINLIQNSLESLTETKRACSEVTVTTIMENDRIIRISVADNGVGLPADNEKIFQPFYTTKSGGMGMGLSICSSIIEFHGGRLTAHNRKPHGAIFEFTLPTHKDEHDILS